MAVAPDGPAAAAALLVDPRLGDAERAAARPRLRAFFDAHRLGTGEPAFRPLGDGHSNITLEVRREGAVFVLRRPPHGPLPPSAHDVLREARTLQALRGRARVPRVLAVGDDVAVIGAPFYLMEKLDGVTVADALPVAYTGAGDPPAVADAFVDGLVALHAIDHRALGLAAPGRADAYLERQQRRFSALWRASRTEEQPAVEAAEAWLARHRPPSPAATVVHGDYRLGNVLMTRDRPPRLVGILDWEMSTVGDPLADVGYMCALWAEPGDPPMKMLDLSAATRGPGFPSRAELAARYADRSGRSVADVHWYQAFALWKAAVLMQGNYRRALSGTSDDPFVREFGNGVTELADAALAVASA